MVDKIAPGREKAGWREACAPARTAKGNRKPAQNVRLSIQHVTHDGKLYQSLSGTFQEQMCKLAELFPVFSTFQCGFPQLHFRLGLEVGKRLPGCLSVPRLFFTACAVMQPFIPVPVRANPSAETQFNANWSLGAEDRK